MHALISRHRQRAAAALLVLLGATAPLVALAIESTPDLAPPLDPASELAPILPEAAREHSNLQSLEALHQALLSKEQQVAEVQRRLIAAEDEITRQALGEELRDLREALAEQRYQFERFALEIDLRPFIDPVEEPFDWQKELSKLLKPILAELENATAESRAIGELRAQISEVAERKSLAAQAVERLESLLASTPSAALRERLEERLTHWQRLADETANRYIALDLQLQNRLEQRQSILDETTSYAKTFFQTRGLNLILAVGAFALVFFGVRALSGLIGKIKPAKTANAFGSRLTALLLHIFSILGGLIAMMLVFNMAGDWFMLGIIIIFLIGVAWASINTLPSQIETVKLVLNIGAVREGECVQLNGVPYRVDTLGFTARLDNPLLEGGVQELPVKMLVGQLSRPAGAREPWFPTRVGDWVELADGHLGEITHQSPSAVRLTRLGGDQVVYPTAAFVAANPRLLSEGFRVSSTFGIDYAHQAIATTEVPTRMREALEQGLAERVDPGQIRAIEVRFHQAAASSLDYRIDVDLAGTAAPKVQIVRDAIQAILVETCNARGWAIPFTQIRLHRAET